MQTAKGKPCYVITTYVHFSYRFIQICATTTKTPKFQTKLNDISIYPVPNIQKLNFCFKRAEIHKKN